jgi:predicted Ser/Thr protein kinase
MDQTSWQKAKDVLYEAQRLPGPEREAYVRLQFKDQPDICDEVLAILPNVDTPDDLSRPLVDLGFQDDELADLQPSTPVKHYTILRRVGRGGMGQVFLALDEKLRRRVALKCLLSRLSLEADHGHILAEAQAAAAISHPNVATVYEVVEHDDRAFMAMEYVDGQSLSAVLARERLPRDRVVAIGLELAGALGAAHANDIVHGDLKPANIALTNEGSAKVLDFGVARAVRAASASTTTLGARPTAQTLTAVAGTPGYMSPEQLRGERIDGRSDLYSLGVVMFEMATGRRPYLETAVDELREAVNRPAPRADAVARGVPRWLADFIAKSLEPQKIARFQSASEMKQALEAVREHVRVLDRRELILRWLARIAIGVPLVILGLGLVGWMHTAGFNFTFGRNGPYARFGLESWRANLTSGALGVFGSLFVATLAAVVIAAVRFAFNAVQAIASVGRVSQQVRMYARDVGVRIGLHRPKGLAQALAGLALATLLVFTQVYRDVIIAWASSFNDSPIVNLLPIGENQQARNHYNQFLDVAIPLFIYGLYRVVRLRRREGSRDGDAALAVLVGVITIMVLMREWPHRTLNKRNLNVLEFDGKHCYLNGQSGEEVLVLCPGGEPPRNHVLRRDDPRLTWTGTSENVFRGVTPGGMKP